MTKKNLITLTLIFTIILIISSIILFLFFNQKENNQKVNKNNSKQETKKTVQKKKRNIYSDNNNDIHPDYSGKIIKEKNGWKRYTNSFWGIEFRFKDKKDKIKIRGTKDRITLLENSQDLNPYVYISAYSFLLGCNDLKSKIENDILGLSPSLNEKLISMEEKINKNNLKYIKLVTQVAGQQASKGKLFIDVKYYIDYNKNDEDYIIIRGDDTLQAQIINSFKFIK